MQNLSSHMFNQGQPFVSFNTTPEKGCGSCKHVIPFKLKWKLLIGIQIGEQSRKFLSLFCASALILVI